MNRSHSSLNRSSSIRFGNAGKGRYIWGVIGSPQAGKRNRLGLAMMGLLAVTFAAVQWYIYDAVHKQAEHFSYYLLTLVYLSGILSPLVLWLSRRWPIHIQTWKRAVPLHIGASIALTLVGVFVEGAIGWYSHAAYWSLAAAERHYFTQHTQIGLVTYWLLIAGAHLYQAHDHSRQRELHAAQLEAQLAEAQLTALRTQLQPHFLFNTLQAATVLIYDDPEGAEEVLLSLSELLRISLQALQQQEIPLRSEIEFLKHYAAIQQRRFGDRLRFEFHVDQEADYCAIPSLLLQPLVENAVRHGMGVRKQPDLVSVAAFIKRDRLIIEIQNRTSALEGALESLVSRGVGLSNTIARLERLYGMRQSFVIRNLAPQGVAVSVSIPVRMLPLPAEELEAQIV